MRQKNAVAERLDVLHDQWVEFARQPEARLLRWVVEPQEARMVEAWLEKEADEEEGECPDLFLRHAPESRYRELLLRVARAAQQGELREVERLGGEAVAVAAGEGWHGLAAAAHWAVAGALLAAGQPHEAAERYRQAEAQAVQAEAQGEAQGAELRLRTRLALGAALVVAQQWASAAALYEETAPQARKLADAHLELECWRMGSFCRESLSEWDRALENGQQAWEVGRGLQPQVRATSTLPYVAEALVRLSRTRLGEEAARRMEAEAEALLGKEWRSDLNTAGSQAA